MRVRVLYHDNCFDGAASSALFTAFYKSCIRRDADFEYVGMSHGPGDVFAGDTFLAHPVPDFFIVPITDEAQRPYEILDGEGNGTNSIYIAGRFMQGGPRTTRRKSDFINVAAGFEGFNFGLDWKLSVSHGESKVTNSDSNFFDANLWAAATSDGSIDPTVTTNDQALVDSLKVTPERVGKSVLETVIAYANEPGMDGGYLLLGLAALSEAGKVGVLYYLSGYLFTVLAAFTVIAVVLRATDIEDISDHIGIMEAGHLVLQGNLAMKRVQ